MADEQPRRDPIPAMLSGVVVIAFAGWLFDAAARWSITRHLQSGIALDPPLARYARARALVAAWWPLFAVAAIGVLIGIYVVLKKGDAFLNKRRARRAGFSSEPTQQPYSLGYVDFDIRQQIVSNPAPQQQVFVGVSEQGTPVYWSDQARAAHSQVIGYTGCGKTKGFIEPVMLQDLHRHRGVLVIDGKASQENEERLIAMARVSGRLADLRIFTLNPIRSTCTYNPVYLLPNADPRAIAERVFSSFSDDMDSPYYLNQSRDLFVNLVEALASSGMQFSMRDIAAAIADEGIMDAALNIASDQRAVNAIRKQFKRLGHKAGETFTGLLASVNHYDHPSVNSYEPDIVLQREVDANRVVAFFLPSNYLKQLSRYLGVCVLQELQQVGAMRQMDRSRSQTPLYVFIDEFYSFAYEGFTDAVNKLRDANIAMLLAHQSSSDLKKVSEEYAEGIWDNTRSKFLFYQNNPKFCDFVANAIGTKRDVKLTSRVSADGFLNAYDTLEASSREVDEFRCHPNRLKALRPRGQAYFVNDGMFVGLNVKPLPDELFHRVRDVQAPLHPSSRGQGVGLYEMFCAQLPARKRAPVLKGAT